MHESERGWVIIHAWYLGVCLSLGCVLLYWFIFFNIFLNPAVVLQESFPSHHCDWPDLAPAEKQPTVWIRYRRRKPCAETQHPITHIATGQQLKVLQDFSSGG